MIGEPVWVRLRGIKGIGGDPIATSKRRPTPNTGRSQGDPTGGGDYRVRLLSFGGEFLLIGGARWEVSIFAPIKAHLNGASRSRSLWVNLRSGGGGFVQVSGPGKKNRTLPVGAESAFNFSATSDLHSMYAVFICSYVPLFQIVMFIRCRDQGVGRVR